MKLLDTLTQEHVLIRQLVGALERASARLKGGDDTTGLVAEILVALSRAVEQVHMIKEEQVVFPYLHDRGLTRSTAVINALAAQHDAITACSRRMEAACEAAIRGETRARGALCDEADTFVGLFREHMRIEEQYFYELADGVIDSSDVEALSARFVEIDQRADAAGARALASRVLARADR